MPVQVRTPAVVERAESVSASGSVEGSETADVAFLVGGTVARVLVEEGQHVSQRTVAGGNRTHRLPQRVQRRGGTEGSGGRRRTEGRRRCPETGTRTGPHRIRTRGRRIQAHEVPGGTKEPASERLSEDRGGVQSREGTLRHGAGRDAEGRSRHSHCTSTRRGRPGERRKQAAQRHASPRADFRQHLNASSRPWADGGRRNAGLLDRRPQSRSKSALEFRRPKSAKSTKAPRRRSPRLRSTDAASQERWRVIGVAAEPTSRTYTVKILVPNPGPVLLAGMVAEARIFGTGQESSP